ncbi:MAG TPA: phosphoribosylaminoimidazolesuccinocarboxamide synthase [Saprospiraceae bacterium]|jgi:phosphoribosylaminoimidazole-succinocarboxamide synthase|nr:MAG: phosphoribosylaminoimidazole-succinocarboxamide synthase [Candidatus Parvibacillus calidus]MBX2935905.1 phosphoribosylaminoimidazolesuccinocarboxamide synthase [Saprospiraceae bacterium]MBK7741610.1 phosphoribosylaminoimidazolesuccinocarboxamide synthase [Candidatus Parvibacillus calidus]MBX7179420.1 phosphoribosylaminoimidazolesuccinocarboxamide synthase [Saprospiraceae bacterium]MCB0590584.1 phosphoribosylaminoimidazolesuccinocarboxamide synthase [Saprospiraceae bacterium]
MEGIRSTLYNLPDGVTRYEGKVRDVFTRDNIFVSVASDRISAFDHILPRSIPYKGQVLNQIAAYFLDSVRDIIPVWLDSTPDPNVSVGRKCTPIRIEMVVRGYLSGHSWREYRSGKRFLCGVPLPEGLMENDPFPEPIITPSTKAMEGHDEDISKEEILERNLVDRQIYEEMEIKSRQLFERGTQMALKRGLILVDTKYEFGIYNGALTLMDELHTPDSSRYFYLDTYFENQILHRPQNQLSKEFVREWLIANGFQGRTGDKMPLMDDSMVETVSKRYIELYEKITGRDFIPASYDQVDERISRVLNGIFG